MLLRDFGVCPSLHTCGRWAPGSQTMGPVRGACPPLHRVLEAHHPTEGQGVAGGPLCRDAHQRCTSEMHIRDAHQAPCLVPSFRMMRFKSCRYSGEVLCMYSASCQAGAVSSMRPATTQSCRFDMQDACGLHVVVHRVHVGYSYMSWSRGVRVGLGFVEFVGHQMRLGHGRVRGNTVPGLKGTSCIGLGWAGLYRTIGTCDHWGHVTVAMK